MKTLITALTIALTAVPAFAGGPVIAEDRTETVEPERPRNWVLPIIIGGIVLCAIACGGDDEPAPVVNCNKGC